MTAPALAGARVAVTGATGFLGGALARALCQAGAEVHALRRAGSDVRPLGDLPIAWHEGDVLDPAGLRRFLRGADRVVHAAGRLGEAGVPEQVYRRINVDGAGNVLAAALAVAPGARVLHLSSPGVLGPTPRAPADESAPHRPENPYERSKSEAERLAVAFAGKGLAVRIARPGFVYGPGDRHVLGLFRAVARGRFFLVDGGRSLCQPTHVDDAVDGMLACLESGRDGEPYHLVGPRAVSFRELADALARALDVAPPRLNLPRAVALAGAAGLELAARVARRPAPLSRSGVRFFSEDRVCSFAKAARELGYAPRRDLAEGLADTVAWYRRQGWL
ncbi:NAD-dependent epimerase/dehydratase family protein [Anaeromyxobacter paludicola]|uniref:Oxidoreductase n=1 Tax=Anaeromyxobacter paludicola TaxID=2918171 RepID=A0ABM7X6J2_9BACT|nr:NAD-dependent epimerase/dehydratase family protein [Anaeromyxobacter paludicola]BDG07431.1 oxidoreductase [Anaeromyxobacter paludicola]